ncbi:hypothetical protein [Sorangium cellulosum]|uniref:Secreted protein n=1 Tax=Sorangium cellulosum TaxID=56 RepID=A0A150QIH2_SORCE|nr:hypothetical protein [Sorangium cellulosum]KYF67516.1 hypothetical protein BE15_20260 [Sorangium cellulosum]
MRSDVLGLGLLALGAVLCGAGLPGAAAVSEARAEPAQVTVSAAQATGATAQVTGATAQAAVSGPTCKLKGTAPVNKGVRLHDAPSGGRTIANFTGALVPMTLSAIPADPASGRARLSTSDGSPTLRIDGYIAPTDIAVFTTRDIPVISGHIWISSAQKVKIVAATGDSLRAELSISGSEGQTARASAPCDAFALQRGAPMKMEVPGSARGYLMKTSTIELFDRPNGDVIFTLKMLEGTAQLFWSTEAKAGFVHLMSRGDLTVDAWGRLKDLEPLKKGELMDQYIPPTTAVAGAQLALDKAPPIVKATRSIPIRARRDEKERPVGEIEAGAEIYLLETVAGWTNVLPKALGMTPPDEGGFWIPAAETPK